MGALLCSTGDSSLRQDAVFKWHCIEKNTARVAKSTKTGFGDEPWPRGDIVSTPAGTGVEPSGRLPRQLPM